MNHYKMNRERGGSALAIIIIILIIALGGLYFWYARGEKAPSQSTDSTDQAALLQELQATGSANLEADLSDLDKELAE